MFAVDTVSHAFDEKIAKKINQKTKPVGALGQLETLAEQIARVQLTLNPKAKQLNINEPGMLVFAADHGIAKYGVSIAPSEVTRQMVLNFANGGAAINIFSRQMGFNLEVIDCGILTPITNVRGITQNRLGAGTAAIHQAPAMSLEQVKQGFSFAEEVVERHHLSGSNLIALGEMGIGNTSAAAAMMAAFLDLDANKCVGRGTGVDDKTFERKTALINEALKLHRSKLVSPVHILAHLGGFEIVQMTGAIMAAAERKMMVMIDGFIATAAALAAVKLHPAARDYLIFSHESNEQGHKLMLAHLNAKPLLALDLRLGEGTGSALALPLVHAAVNFYNDMASFESAGVSNVS
ncbi:nicotinate-nucleotide--dimethylbenzimidazole phosphoribosyltransferase [Shewanella intestini]|uniref:Nicotinate-nucleotide--dimethylbenzimidazole phosphoribosyltransferase n=1 Tax=Shewanella intestini TaxID=2017544 RepID=A0ABS5I381_9GAMM|nr:MULTISPECIES: nicotinate-nucleotide--dimethylbenzimidazole phosphoribosyltransferase [Shewanella]MBR9728488.1 nicotinate-nucleotide--dimethylbenzimidazole phosphoribosyltransferase [Shewanella intestini]MRG36307.1 nicotinate-nucleotide--dimethylbenzimidazole phosphoribosyltransferase [Shewanella sp. XMDDZSB0408]